MVGGESNGLRLCAAYGCVLSRQLAHMLQLLALMLLQVCCLSVTC